LNRRAFIKTGGAVLATAAFSGGEAKAGDPSPEPVRRPIKKAMMFNTVPGGLPVMERFKVVKEAGFAGIEPNSSMDRKEVLAARDATSLEIPSVCAGVLWEIRLSDPDPAIREKAVGLLKTALQDAKTYGATSVLTISGVVDAQNSYDDVYRRSQAELRKALPLAQELQVKIAIENVWNHFLLSPLEAARFIDEFDSPWIGWHFDIGNVINYGWPEQWVRILNHRIAKLHIKEFSLKKRDAEGLWKGFQVDYLEGDNDWPAVMKALDEVGYRGWAIAEPPFHPPGMTPLARLQQISGKMDKILAM
jgi:L-ribulose-5-phosphate 3-epimerase